MKTFCLLWLFIFGSGAALAETAPVDDIEMPVVPLVDRVEAIGEVDEAPWGIRGGCIPLNRIRSINFVNDQSAIIGLGRNKEAILRLNRECTGISSEAFVYKMRGNRLCAKFDSLRLLTSKRDCQIESIEPYLKLEDTGSSGDGL